MDREPAREPAQEPGSGTSAEPCTAIVVHATPAHRSVSADEDCAEEATHSRRANRSNTAALRKIGKADLAWELSDLTEAMDVRHGVLGDQSFVFVDMEPEKSRLDAARWIGTRDERFQRELRARCYQRLKRGPTAPVVEEAIAHVEARGYGLPPEPIARRVALHRGSLWLSLGPASNDVVEITAKGWRIVQDAPVLFLHGDNADTLPVPQPGGRIDQFRRFLPSVSDADWPSLLGFIIATFMPEGALPILSLSGQMNSGKSFATELIRGVCDPVLKLDARAAFPEKPEDLYTLAASMHMLSFDNLTKIDADVSDALCCIATGAAHKVRRLYSQGQLHTLRARNAIILNGISNSVAREDLVSRSIFIELKPIPIAARRKESTLRREFQHELPGILGAILDGVVLALRDGADTTVRPSHRLEDAACFATAAEPGLQLPDGAIVEAWLRSQAVTHVDLGSTDPVVEVLERIMTNSQRWAGTATDLMNQAIAMDEAEDGRPIPKDFPRRVARLGEHLHRSNTTLERAGFKLTFTRSSQSRIITIDRVPSASQSSTVAVTRPSAQAQAEVAP